MARLVLSCTQTSDEVPAFIGKDLQDDQLLNRGEVGSRIRVDIDSEDVVVQLDERVGSPWPVPVERVAWKRRNGNRVLGLASPAD